MAEHMRKRSEKFGFNLADTGLLKMSKIANSRFYGAPHGIFLYQDQTLPTWSILDIGMFAHGLMLAANAHGVGTVPQAFLTDYPATVKRLLKIPDSKRLVPRHLHWLPEHGRQGQQLQEPEGRCKRDTEVDRIRYTSQS